MSAVFTASTPAAGDCSWKGDTRPGYRGGESVAYLAGAVMQTESGPDLTTEALASFTTE